jgi:hypothetical protein
MVYYLSSRDSSEGQYAMSMDLDTLKNRKFDYSYSALTWLVAVPIAVFIAVFALLALMQPGFCCTVDENTNMKCFSRGKAFGVAILFALIALGVTGFLLSKLE